MDALRGILLPSTDAGVFFQAVLAIALFGFLLVHFWARPDLRLLIIGISIVTAGLFGLRAVH